MKTRKRVPEFFTWTLRVAVHRSWVADGFTLDKERAQGMLWKALPHAFGYELHATILKKPDHRLVRKAQGY